MSINKLFLQYPSGDKPIVFCFHHAGGSARAYCSWLSNTDIDFIPIELPGHGRRIREQMEIDIVGLSRTISKEIVKLLKKYDDIPSVSLFGHSMGAIIAFRVSYLLENQYGINVLSLHVAGRHAPQHEDPTHYRTHMGIEALIGELREVGHTPLDILLNKDFREFMLPIIFSDYKLSESYLYDGEMINHPIFAYCGEKDSGAQLDHMRHWGKVTNKRLNIKSYNGDHFFLLDKKIDYVGELVRDIFSLSHTREKTKTKSQCSTTSSLNFVKGWI